MSGVSKNRMGFGALLACMVASVGKSMTLDVMNGKDSCVIVNAEEGNNINGNFELLTPGYLKDFMVVLQGPTGLIYRKTGMDEDYFRFKAPKAGEYVLCFLNKAKDKMDDFKEKYVDKNVVKSFGIDRLREDNQKDGKDDELLTLSSSMDFETDDGLIGDDFDSWYAANPGYRTVGFGLRVAEDIDSEDMSSIKEDEKKTAIFLTEEAEALVQALRALNDHEGYRRGKEEIHRSSVGQTASRLIWYTFIEGVVLLAVSWTQLSYIRRFFETKRIL